MAKGNTLQAMLDRAKAGGETPATTTPIAPPAWRPEIVALPRAPPGTRPSPRAPPVA